MKKRVYKGERPVIAHDFMRSDVLDERFFRARIWMRQNGIRILGEPEDGRRQRPDRHDRRALVAGG